MAATIPRLIYCAANNKDYATVAVECGWTYGAQLPGTVYRPIWFADQNWKKPRREAYMEALKKHRPEMATVVDWETDGQLPEVIQWAEEAAQYVGEFVCLIPKVVGGIPRIPERIGGKIVVLGYSVPTMYGGSPVPIWEYAGRKIHLLGGSPQEQMRLWRVFSPTAEVVSLDGNMAAQQSRKGRTWTQKPGHKGHWRQLAELGDNRTEGVPLECFCRSLIEIRRVWSGML